MFKTRLISGIVLVLIALLTVPEDGYCRTLLALSLVGVLSCRAVGLWKKENAALSVYRTCGSCVLLSSVRIQSRCIYYDGPDSCAGRDYGCLCVFLSQIPCRAKIMAAFLASLRGSHAFLRVSDPECSGWCFPLYG